MIKITTEQNDIKLLSKVDLNIIQLDQNRGNVIDLPFLKKFENRLQSISENDPLIIIGNNRFFCSGLDLKLCQKINRDEFYEFINLFQNLLLKIINWDNITACLLNGHAVAGGFLLASSADLRFVTNGNFKFGMNEKKLGIDLPPVPLAILKKTYPDIENQILGADHFYSASELENLSIAELNNDFNIDQIMERVRICAMDPCLKKIKTDRSKEIQLYLEKYYDRLMIKFIDDWWSPDAQLIRQNIVERLNQKEAKR